MYLFVLPMLILFCDINEEIVKIRTLHVLEVSSYHNNLMAASRYFVMDFRTIPSEGTGVTL